MTDLSVRPGRTSEDYPNDHPQCCPYGGDECPCGNRHYSSFILALVGTTRETHPDLWAKYMGEPGQAPWLPTQADLDWVNEQIDNDGPWIPSPEELEDFDREKRKAI